MDMQQPQQTSFILPALVYDTLRQMRDAKAARNKWEYWVHFHFLAQCMVPHSKPQHRAKIQSDFEQLIKIEKEIKNSQLNETSKESQITEARFIFADNREYFIFNALPNIGIGTDVQDGVIDFDKIKIEDLETVVQKLPSKKLETADKLFLKEGGVEQ